MKIRKALSPVIGMIIVILVIIAILIPFAYLLFSIPVAQSNYSNQAEALNSQAKAQLQEIEVIQNTYQLLNNNTPAYYGLVYYNNNLYVVFINNNQPPIPLTITSIYGLTDNGWTLISSQRITISSPNSEFNNLPSFQIPLSSRNNYKYLAISTNLGNLITIPPYQPIPISKAPIPIVALQTQTFKVLQNPTYISLYSQSLLINPIYYTLENLTSKIGNSFTVIDGIIFTSNKQALFDGFYFGPIGSSNNTLNFTSSATSPVKITNLYAQTSSGTTLNIKNGSIIGNISLNVPTYLLLSSSSSLPDITAVGNSKELVKISINIYNASVTLYNFTGTINNGVYKNLTNYTAQAYAIIKGLADKVIILPKTIKNSFGINTYTSPVINGSIIAPNIVISSGQSTLNSNFNVQFTNTTITASNVSISSNNQLFKPYSFFNTFFGNIYAILPPYESITTYSSFNYLGSAIISINTADTDLQDIKIGPPPSYNFFSQILTPIKIYFSFGIFNPSSSDIEVKSIIILFNEQFVGYYFNNGKYSGTTQGEAIGLIQTPCPIIVPPGQLVSKSVILSIPLQYTFFSPPEAYNPSSESPSPQPFSFTTEPTYETISLDLVTNYGYVSEGTFVIPVNPPITVYSGE